MEISCHHSLLEHGLLVNLFIARFVYVLLALSIYTVSLLSVIYLFLQPDHYLAWWSILLSGPIFMSCLLLFSLLITWFGQIGDSEHESLWLRMCSWYYQACAVLRLESSIAQMCAWLTHLHFLTGCFAAVLAFVAYLADSSGPFLNIAALLFIYVVIIFIFSSIRKNIAPQEGVDY